MTTATDEESMLTTKRKPATVGEILVEEFMRPVGLTQAALAEAMGVQRRHVNELCNGRRNVTAATAFILARVVRQQPRLLAQRAAAQRFVGSVAQPQAVKRIKRAKPLDGRGGVIWRPPRSEQAGRRSARAAASNRKKEPEAITRARVRETRRWRGTDRSSAAQRRDAEFFPHPAQIASAGRR